MRWSDAKAAARQADLWRRVRQALPAEDDASVLVRRDIDRVEDLSDTLLTMIRTYRNDAGHAAPVEVDEEAVRAFVAVFPSLTASISRVVAQVAALSA